jgi:hypothetical protein
MERLRLFLEAVRDAGYARGRLRGLMHIAIGRKITDRETKEVISSGVTWRELATLFKLAKYDKDLVREFAPDPDEISPRDREKFWYSAIALGHPDSVDAYAQAEELVKLVSPLGYQVGPPPSAVATTHEAPKPKPKPDVKKKKGK